MTKMTEADREILGDGDSLLYADTPQRREATYTACQGIPTAAIEAGVVKKMYAIIASFALADHLADRQHGSISFPENWWNEVFRRPMDELNEIMLTSGRSALTGKGKSK